MPLIAGHTLHDRRRDANPDSRQGAIGRGARYRDSGFVPAEARGRRTVAQPDRVMGRSSVRTVSFGPGFEVSQFDEPVATTPASREREKSPRRDRLTPCCDLLRSVTAGAWAVSAAAAAWDSDRRLGRGGCVSLRRDLNARVPLWIALVKMLEEGGTLLLVERFVVGARQASVENLLDGTFHPCARALTLSPVEHQQGFQPVQ